MKRNYINKIVQNNDILEILYDNGAIFTMQNTEYNIELAKSKYEKECLEKLNRDYSIVLDYIKALGIGALGATTIFACLNNEGIIIDTEMDNIFGSLFGFLLLTKSISLESIKRVKLIELIKLSKISKNYNLLKEYGIKYPFYECNKTDIHGLDNLINGIKLKNTSIKETEIKSFKYKK